MDDDDELRKTADDLTSMFLAWCAMMLIVWIATDGKW